MIKEKIPQAKVEALGKLALKDALGMASRVSNGGKKTLTANKFFSLLYEIVYPFLTSFADDRISRLGRAGCPETAEDLVSVGFIAVMKRLPFAYVVDRTKPPFMIGRSIIDYALQSAKGEIKDHLMTRRSLVATTKPAIKKNKITSSNLFEVFLEEKKTFSANKENMSEVEGAFLLNKMNQENNFSMSTSLNFSPEERVIVLEKFKKRRIIMSRLFEILSEEERMFALILIGQVYASDGRSPSLRLISERLGLCPSWGSHISKHLLLLAENLQKVDVDNTPDEDVELMDKRAISLIESYLKRMPVEEAVLVRDCLFPREVGDEMGLIVSPNKVAERKKTPKNIKNVAGRRGRPPGIRREDERKRKKTIN